MDDWGQSIVGPFPGFHDDPVVLPMVQLYLKFTHTCRHTRMLAYLTRIKHQKLAGACTVARNFGMRTWASEHM